MKVRRSKRRTATRVVSLHSNVKKPQFIKVETKSNVKGRTNREEKRRKENAEAKIEDLAAFIKSIMIGMPTYK